MGNTWSCTAKRLGVLSEYSDSVEGLDTVEVLVRSHVTIPAFLSLHQARAGLRNRERES